ncbi:MAG: cell division protein ZapE [Proteobacteria bacterium]|nr:MAG: cell division protein ZapE [Pseudomonadota bacterium]
MSETSTGPRSAFPHRELGPALIEAFREIARAHSFSLDASQERAVAAFQRLTDDLHRLERRRWPWEQWIGRRPWAAGIYLWGPVGRGKSFLMDEFFRIAPATRKERIHFHRFMQGVHHDLRALQGTTDPLKSIATRIGARVRLLCLDEFHVTDIGDAMLMRGLLEGMVEQGVVLVTTSNQHPDELYAHGLQRAQFLPAVELIKTQLEVVELDGGSDYRLRTLTDAGVYHHPSNAAAEQALQHTFEAIAGGSGQQGAVLEIEGRELSARRLGHGVVWLGFEELCEQPRGTADYIELARRYHTVLVSDVPQFRADQADSVRRFTWLVDEFYDRHVKLIVAAEVSAERLHERLPVRAETERARSRLIEMQTTQYLSLPHLA